MNWLISRAILPILLCLASIGPIEGQGQSDPGDSIILLKANTYLAAGLPDSALRVWTLALDEHQHAIPVDTLRVLNARQQRGYLLYRLGRYTDALPDLQDALALTQAYYGAQSRETGEALLQVGDVFFYQAAYPTADSIYRMGLLILRSAAGENDLKTGWARHNCGLTALYSGRFLAALEEFEKALAIKRKYYGEDNEDVARTLTFLGFLYNLFGDYEKGDACTESAARISLRTYGPDELGYYYAKNNLVELHIHRGEFDLAKRAAREAIAGKTRLLDTSLYYDIAGSWNWLGLAFQAASQFDSAQWAFKKALRYHQWSGYKRDLEQAHVLHNMGTTALSLGQPDSSLTYLDQALAAKAAINGPGTEDYVSTLIMRGSARMAKGQPDSALTDLQSAMMFLETNSILNGLNYRYCLGECLDASVMLGKWAEARALAFKLVAANKRKVIEYTNFGSEREMLMASEEAQGTLWRLYDLNARWPGSQDTALVRLLADETLFYNGFVLNEMAGIRHQLYRDTLHRQLFDALNMAKSRWLAVQLKLGVADPSLPFIRSQVDSLEKALIRSSHAYAGFRQSWTTSDVIHALRPGEAMIVFTEMERTNGIAPVQEYAAFLFRSDDQIPRHFRLFAVSDQERNETSAFSIRHLSESGFLLDSLWLKIEPFLAGIERLYYLPAGELCHVNLAALSLDDGTLLMEHLSAVRLLNVRRIPSHDILAKKPMDAVIAGGIDYDAPSTGGSNGPPTEDEVTLRGAPWTERGTSLGAWSGLPGTAAEVETIRKLLAAQYCETIVLSGQSATEEAFRGLGKSARRGRSPEILHLATHGYYIPYSEGDEQRPMAAQFVFPQVRDPMVRSGIILAGANAAWTGARSIPTDRDGIATASEISQLDLSDTRIVVLSACESGLGDITSGEGVMGLQRAFRIAGADKIMVSLWKVPDAATSYLMGQLYHYWIVDGLSPRQALERAQRHMRDDGFPLSHWAGFVLTE